MFTNGTQNYNLPQWLPQDKPTWLGDMNSAFLAIDTNLKQVSDTATIASNAASNANTKIGADDISSIGTSLTNAVVNLNNLIGAWTSQLGADIATAITTIKQDITIITSTIGAWTSQIGTNIASAITTLKEKVSTIETTIGTWSSSIGTSIASAITTLKSKVSTIETTIGTWTTAIGTNIASAITNLKENTTYENGTYTLLNEENMLGMLTYGGTIIAFTYVLPKQIPNNKNITINSFSVYIRDNNGYLKTNAGDDITAFSKTRLEEEATISITHEQQLLRILFTFNNIIKDSSGNNKTASSICGVAMGHLNITIS